MKTYIDFKPAKCRDCYLCLKGCPVKAIKLMEHQARIIPERCIQCGSCTRVCPQNAKSVHSELEDIRSLLNGEKTVVASVAPSFISSFELTSFKPMLNALKELGISYAEETAVGAAAVTERYAQLLRTGEYKNLLSSACPSINRMIQFYFPNALKYLAPVDSPMTAHAKMLRERFPEAIIIFIGPCISKKREADECKAVDSVMTFDELKVLLDEKNIQFKSDDEYDTAETAAGASARRYPTGAGIIKSFQNRPRNYEYLAIDSIKKCSEVLKNIDTYDHMFIEMDSCEFGCINGPCSMLRNDATVLAEVSIRKYAASAKESGVSCPDNIGREFPKVFDGSMNPSERDIQNILAKTGKFKKEDELNCGACGYNTCREKAWAVFNGYADEDLCIPYMRSKAESVSSEVMRRMPFGILVLNSSFNIESINKAAMNILGIDAFHPEGQQLFDFVSIPDFVIAQSSNTNILNKRISIDKTGKVAELSIVLLKEHGSLLGIIKDVTEENTYNEKMRQLRQKTFKVTDDVVKKQMRIAQEIASLLGETTAETKVALLKLKDIMQEEE